MGITGEHSTAHELHNLMDAKDTLLLDLLVGLEELRDQLRATSRKTVHGQVFLNKEIDAVESLLEMMR